MNFKIFTLSLALLIPLALNAMIDYTPLELGSETSYKELAVVASLFHQGKISTKSLTRYYTDSNARLHKEGATDKDTITIGNYVARVRLFSTLEQNNTQVVVNYNITQHPMLSWIFNPTTIKNDSVHLTVGGKTHTVEHTSSDNETVTLTLAAKWEEKDTLTDMIDHLANDSDSNGIPERE